MHETTVLNGLTCEIKMPLRWSVKEGGASAPQISDHESMNLSRLHSILGLDDVLHHEFSDEVPHAVGEELQRIDFKVNIILEMLAKLVTTSLQLPPVLEVSLGPSAMRWHCETNEPEVGAHLILELYLDERFPYALSLSGRVDRVEEEEGRKYVLVIFDTMSEAVSELLEKYIFRCHRRHIARLKKAAVKERGGI